MRQFQKSLTKSTPQTIHRQIWYEHTNISEPEDIVQLSM